MVILTDRETKIAVLEMVADAMRVPLFPITPTDQRSPADTHERADLEAMIATAEKELLAAFTEKFAALRVAASTRPAASSAVAATSDGEINDLITPGHAVHLTGMSRPTLYRLCTRHPIGAPGGFSLKREGERFYLISQSRLERFVRDRPRRVIQTETKKPRSETK